MPPKNQGRHEAGKPKPGNKGSKSVPTLSPKKPTFTQEPVETLPEFPDLAVPTFPAEPSEPKKWCVRNNVAVHKPAFEFSVGDATVPMALDDSFSLKKNDIVRLVSKDDALPGWSGIAYQETRYRNIDVNKKDWVTTRVAGWVWNDFLDDYFEEFPESRTVVLTHQSKFSADGEQDLIVANDHGIFDEFTGVKYNLCGELSISFVLHKDIETVINTWKSKSFAIYNRMIGTGHDEPLGQTEMDDLFRIFADEIKAEHYVPDPPAPLESKIAFAANNDLRHASAAFQNKLKDNYLITNVRINTNTGELVRRGDEPRNHWVVVDRLTHNGSRVELYNPFPNKRQSYSFGEFYNSVGSLPNRGWWVLRRPDDKLTEEDESVGERDDYAVAIDNQTPNPDDAEQYMFVEGAPTKKNMLCGEFSVSFILTQSLERNLKNWLDAHEQQQPELWELARILQAYGLNHRKYVVKGTAKLMDPLTGKETSIVTNSLKLDLDSKEEYFKSFSIDTVLKYWKTVQPTLYESILGDRNDTGTGLEDLKTILKAYGYEGPEDITYYSPPPGERLSPPGKDQEKLKTHYLIASVLIETLRGSLIRWDPILMGNGKPKGTAFHWVVVTKITPVGSEAGGNGGWVEIYNPFSNGFEEYSYKEFKDSDTAPGLWIKREITPAFSPQKKASARIGNVGDVIGQSADKKGKKGAGPKTWTVEKLMGEIQKMRNNGKTDGQIPALIFGKGAGGWSKDEIGELVARSSSKPGVLDSRPVDDLQQKLVDGLKLKVNPPEEVVALLRRISKGDTAFAFEVVNSLREFGLLVFGEGPTMSIRESPLPGEVPVTSIPAEFSRLHSSGSALANRVANAIGPMFTAQVLKELTNIRDLAAIEEQKAKEKAANQTLMSIPMSSGPTPAYRVMWDWERIDMDFRFNVPAVFRCGQKDNPSNGHYVNLTSEWQFFWFNLCCKVVFGCYEYELTDERRELLAHKWTSLGDTQTAFTNQHGVEKFRNYVLGERLRKEDPKIYTLVCGGASLAGTPVKVTKGKKNEWLLKVSHFDGTRKPPPVESIDPETDPRVFFATIITNKKIPGPHQVTIFDEKVGPSARKIREITEGFRVDPFPQFNLNDQSGKRSIPIISINCPVPIIANEDIYYPLKYLVPIDNGVKANPYFPPR